MVYLSKNAAIIKIKLLQNSQAKNYFETNERIFLNNTLEKLVHTSTKEIQSDLTEQIELLFKKYQKYI